MYPAFFRVTRIAPIAAAIAWGMFVPAEAYSIVLMPTSWFVFIFWFVVWRLVRTDRPPSTALCFGLGLLIGVTAMGVATILFVVPLVFAALILKRGSDHSQLPSDRKIDNRWAKVALAGALLVAGVVAGTSPCWVHNYFIAHDPVVLSAHSGVNFWIGNNPDANGYPKFPPGLRAGQSAMLEDSINAAQAAAGHRLKRAEVSAFWSGQAKQFVRTHLLAWFQLLGRKFANFWSAFQYDDLSIITTLREHGVILPGIYYGLVAAIGIPGMILGWRRYRRSRWITAAIFLHMCALLPVFVTERYRLAAVPGLLILSAVGLSMLWQSIVAMRSREIVVYVGVLLVATTCVAWPKRAPSLWALDAYNSGWQALQANDFDLAEKKLGLARAYVLDNEEGDFALGNLRLAQGRRGEASAFYRETLKIDRHHKGALNNLGVMALDEGDLPAARMYLQAALGQDRGNPKTHYLLAKAALAMGDIHMATALIDRAIALGGERSEFVALRAQIAQRP
jgi:hypothetical protein